MSTDQRPGRPSPTTDPYAALPAEPTRVPDWMREPSMDRVLTRSERFRLGLTEHRSKLLGGFVALVAVSAFAVLGLGGLRDTSVAPENPGGPGQLRPTDADGNSVSPWAATPAESFATGAEAIVLPPAKAAGPFTRRQVTDGLAKVRQALIEARIDTSMVSLADPEPFLKLLAPDARDVVRRDLADGAALSYATRVGDSAQPRLEARDRLRAQGTVTYRATTDPEGVRVLEVTTSFIWVYNFDLYRAQDYPAGAELATVRDRVVWHLPYPDDVAPSARGLWVYDAASTMLNADCAGINRGLLALEPKDRFPGGPGSENLPNPRPEATPTGDLYDPGWRPGDGESC
ncbi:hypothetical protein [Micromonospora musae]|uniref:hypothetical protein n=1 Tax=Micromonospora musae TaxID=1894970 RepID=UPI00343EBD5F